MSIKRFLRNFALVGIFVFWSTIIQMLNGERSIFSLFKLTKSTEEHWIVFSLSIAMVFFINWIFKQVINVFNIKPTSISKINLKYDLCVLGPIFANSLILFQIIIPYDFSYYIPIYGFFMSLVAYQIHLVIEEEKNVITKFEINKKQKEQYEEFKELHEEMLNLYTEYHEIKDDENASAKKLRLVNTFSEIIGRKNEEDKFNYKNSENYPYNADEIEVYNDYWQKRNFLFNKLKSTMGYGRDKESTDCKIINALKTIEHMNADPNEVINIALTKSSYHSDWFKMCFKESDPDTTPLNKLEALSTYYYSIIISLNILLSSVKEGILLLEKDFVTGQTDYEKYNAQFNLLKNHNEFEIVLKSLFAEME